MSEALPFEPKKPLSEEQLSYWWEQLEFAERKVEYAKKMLGIIATEGEIK